MSSDERISTAELANAGLDVRFGTVAPPDPQIGTQWINHKTNERWVWSGASWMPPFSMSTLVAPLSPVKRRPIEPIRSRDLPESSEDAW